jgi:uncharacterized membrane protein HdeD (DUF308 family)
MFDMLTRNWWTLALRGLAAVVFGVLTLAWPGLSLRVLIALFGAFALVNGVMAIVGSYQAHERHLRWGSLLAVGILDLIAAGVTWFWPGLTALALLYVVVAWALVTGILSIGAAIEFHDAGPHAWLLALSGVLSVALAVILAVDPRSGILSLVLVVGIYAIAGGVTEIVFAFHVRSLGQNVRTTVSHMASSA